MPESKTGLESSAPSGSEEPSARASREAGERERAGVGPREPAEKWQAAGVGPRGAAKNDDPDVHKGAVEGDRPDQPQNANPHGPGVNEQGLPNDPVAIAEDTLGANEDESQG